MTAAKATVHTTANAAAAPEEVDVCKCGARGGVKLRYTGWKGIPPPLSPLVQMLHDINDDVNLLRSGHEGIHFPNPRLCPPLHTAESPLYCIQHSHERPKEVSQGGC